MRLMKLTEEAGEVMQAYIGMVGQNPRKGVTHSRADVADELCDVIVTAMVALHSFTDDPEQHLATKIQTIADRSREHATDKFIDAAKARDPQELEELRHEAWCRDDACPTCDGTGGDHQIGCQP